MTRQRFGQVAAWLMRMKEADNQKFAIIRSLATEVVRVGAVSYWWSYTRDVRVRSCTRYANVNQMRQLHPKIQLEKDQKYPVALTTRNWSTERTFE